MTIDQDRKTENAERVGHQLAEDAMIRLVDAIDTRKPLLDRKWACIDLLAFRHDAGNRAETSGDANRARIDVTGEGAAKHLRVELIWLAVHVEPGAGKIRAKKRNAELRRRDEKLIDMAVFGTANSMLIETRSGQEIGGIGASAMWRVEHNRQALPERGDDFEQGSVQVTGRRH